MRDYRKRVERRKELGKCIGCKRENSGANLRCPICSEKQSQIAKKRFAKRKEEGLCTRCDNPVELGKVNCEEHAAEAIRLHHIRKNLYPSKKMWMNAKKRSRELNLAFSITEQDIVIPKRCPVLGFILKFGTRKSHYASPSLDRIIPSKGYVKGNVQVISQKANTMKQNATPKELRMFAKWVLKK